MSEFDGRVGIVTGGASGIGRALCEALGSRGARVVVADINEDGAQAVAAGITAAGGRVEAVRVDTANADDVQALVDNTVSAHARLDYMFNNAGIGIAGDYRDMTLDDWRRVIDVNLWGVIYGTHAAYRVMAEQGSGHIVNTASMAGLVAPPMLALYTTAKFGVVGLSASLRAEGAALGVKVSVVCPGVVRTPLVEEMPVVRVDRAKIMEQLPTRLVEPPSAAATILRGVERNRAYIVFPLTWRIAWWFFRLHPVFIVPLARKMAADFRALRTAP